MPYGCVKITNHEEIRAQTRTYTRTHAVRDTNSHHSWCGAWDGLVGTGGSQAVFFFHFPDMITLKTLCATPTHTCLYQSVGEKKQRVQSHINPCAGRWGAANNGGSVCSVCESARPLPTHESWRNMKGPEKCRGSAPGQRSCQVVTRHKSSTDRKETCFSHYYWACKWVNATLTWAAEFMLLHLRHVETSELSRWSALGEQTHCGPLPEPLR